YFPLDGMDEANADNSNTEIFPNPANGEFTLTTQIPAAEIEIINIMGEVVYKQKLENAFGEKQHRIEIKNAKGVYIVHIFNRNICCTKKLIMN
ncbi:MAG: T9SS type A sorting domain-containing protein, partial [Sphingobacteriales bacterium]